MKGDTADFAQRLRRVLPTGWFPDTAPALDTLLQGLGQGWADLYAMLTTVQTQTRLTTVQGAFLDLAAADYRGAGGLMRRGGEPDAAYRARLLPIFRDRVTRPALIARLKTLTGNAPVVFEPTRPGDTGGYGIACGYGVAGGYGSLVLPDQFFVTVQRPAGAGIPLVAGYGSPSGGYGVGRAVYGTLASELPHVTDMDIYAAVNDVRPAGSIAWVALTGAAIGGYGFWDETFVWDSSTWAS